MPKDMPKAAGKRPRGRPRERAYRDGERVPLSLRVTPQTKHWLDKASAMSGRSQSQEVEFRLEQSEHTQWLLLDALKLRHGIMGSRLILALSAALEALRQVACHFILKERGEWNPDYWLDDPRCYAAAEEALSRVIARVRPVDPAPPPPLGSLEQMPTTWVGLGTWAADWALVDWQMELFERGLAPSQRKPAPTSMELYEKALASGQRKASKKDRQKKDRSQSK